jgi:hypothetical protein
LLGKHNWVCTICGQDFTRRSIGNRHNSNLHGGMAKLVRPFDYMIDRLNGQISSPERDPWTYRSYRRKDNNQLANHGLKINGTFIKQNDVGWNNSRPAVVHERNLPKQEQRQQYQDTNNYMHSMLGAPKLQVESQSSKSSKCCCPNTAVLAMQRSS